jgi:hypothetical protein
VRYSHALPSKHVDDEPSLLVSPAGQLSQLADPEVGANDPASHGSHSEELLLPLNMPGGHS